MTERCWKCATPVRSSPGIGEFCPNPACDVFDALDAPRDVALDAPQEAAFVVTALPRPRAATTREVQH